MRRRTTVALASAAVIVAVAAIGTTAIASSDPAVVQTVAMVKVGNDADGTPVSLDTTLFVPKNLKGTAPAVLLAHGFGGSKDDETADALDLARHGFVALTYSARGFGHSGGQISLDAPQYEVADASRLIDLLATNPHVTLDKPGDPVVGVAGGSYGGALTLEAAGYDQRIDAIVPAITWNELGQSLFPQFAQGTSTPGVFKKQWAADFFGTGSGDMGVTPTTCGKFAAAYCAAYQASAAAGRPTPEILALMAANSPARILDKIKAPTLLIQGEADSLFPLSEGDANAKGIAAGGTPVKLVWYGGGHDGGLPETKRIRSLTLDWFDHYLKNDKTATDTRFEVTVTNASLSASDSQPKASVRVAPGLPGVTAAGSTPRQSLALTGARQTVIAPAGGNPAALTSLPGFGSALSTIAQAGGLGDLSTLPGQVATFETAPLTKALQLTGSSTVDLTVRSTAPTATLFATLLDVPQGDAKAVLPESLVAPIQLTGPFTGQTVRVTLPAIVRDIAPEHRLRVVISTTDQGYAMPADARAYTIGLAAATLSVPVLPLTALHPSSLTGLWVGLAIVVLVLLGAWLVIRQRTRRRIESASDPSLAAVPLVITGLGKAYRGGFRAVSDLTFRVEPGQVLGLLGPNGAGKTTTLRMLMGLIAPTEGEIRVFGHRISPGAPVLSRVGAFVEGPGFPPHLTGVDNLLLYWRAVGRPLEEAHLDIALEIAGLGDDIYRRTKNYSHGMRQRLGIAQAMLGLPELLVLDEPTNGLDPPQIREMRDVLARYAATGRTVIVSSHLLSEVEQTCTDVVVMDRGRLVAQGTVAELVGRGGSTLFGVDDEDAAVRIASALPGVTSAGRSIDGLMLDLNGTPPADVVAALVAAGVRVDKVTPQRRLEEVFLTLVGQEQQ
ncbi:CocE/NonD family hydrolase [Acidothermaceae bacterium B102]|nr:CocE/NonD family hydrolase [Acidothermaceae bacterium B102]